MNLFGDSMNASRQLNSIELNGTTSAPIIPRWMEDLCRFVEGNIHEKITLNDYPK